jgi:hypothetical protein
VRHTFQDESGQVFEAWCAQPTDIIIGKLRAWAEGPVLSLPKEHSAKHPADIHAMLAFALGGLGTETIDLPAIALQAARLGPQVAALWETLVNRAENQVRGYQGT